MARRGGWTYRVHKCWCGRAGFPSKNGVRCAEHAAMDEAINEFATLNETDPERMALAILDKAENTLRVKSLARELAGSGELTPPRTASEFLYWIEYEASFQEDIAEIESDLLDGKAAAYRQRAQALRDVAEHVRDLGIVPAPPPGP
ncbi:MAG: hypothetical protein ACOYYS_18695 [Chloroflexota bacterium]